MTPNEYIKRLRKSELHNVMLAAIDMMQSYNGRTVSECIVLAVGGEVIEGEDSQGNYKMSFKMPPLAQIARSFKD